MTSFLMTTRTAIPKVLLFHLMKQKEYIKQHNGTNESYFADYIGGTVSIVCNQTGRIAYQEDVI